MKKERYLLGGCLILSSVFIILVNLGYIRDYSVMKVIAAIILGYISIKSIFKKRFFGVFMPIAFIVNLYDYELGIGGVSPGVIITAAVLLSLGFNLIFNKSWNDFNKHSRYEFREEEINIEDNDYINLSTTFGGSIKYINSDNFKGANLECSFGSMKVYFDNAIIEDSAAIVRLEVSFAGVDLFVPKEWYVDNQTDSAFSGVTEKNRNSEITSKTLVLRGDVSFAGVNIIYI